MKRLIYLSVCLAIASCSTETSLVDYVDPMIGTGGHGHTYPGAAAPYGMVQLSPDTRTSGWDACSGYHYDDNTILGFSHTHLSGTGCADLADVLFYPGVGDPVFDADGYAGMTPYVFSHKNETASCGYYSVKMESSSGKDEILAEMTATPRAGVHRYGFGKSRETKYIVIDLRHAVTEEVIDETLLKQVSDNEIIGMRRTQGWTPDQKIWFSAVFSAPVTECRIIGQKQAVLYFSPETDGITAVVGISAVSSENAALNRQQEVPVPDFDIVRNSTRDRWEEELSDIIVTGGSEKERRIFYTSLYHSKLSPNVMNDVNGEYVRHDGTVDTLPEGRTYWSTFSLWDTFRAWHPLQTILDTAFVSEMASSLLDMYEDTGELPIWPLWSGETGTMIGYHSASVIADAYLRGIRGFDAEKALEAMVRSSSINKKGASLYAEYGFVPADVKRESVSLTLEYAYDDWCIARLAEAVGNASVAQEYYKRARNYINVFDGSTGFFRGRNRDGSRTDPFNVFSTGRDYTEATPWHYRFFVPHDVNGMVGLFGGKEELKKALDELFTVESDEMSLDVADVTGLKGQYAQGNEPSHNFAWLYSYIGEPAETQRLTRELLEEMYTTEPDGIIGNEDCGQMSAWYIFASLGFYPVCPGTGEFVFTSPVFDKAEIRLAGGKTLTITANGSRRNKYIGSISLNGNNIDNAFITYDQIMGGGNLEFTLVKTPSGLSMKAPYSMSGDNEASLPYTESAFCLFEDSLDFTLGTATSEAEIRYTTDGSEPGSSSALYTAPIRLAGSTVIKARAFKEGCIPSEIAEFKATRAEYIPGLRVAGLRQGVSYKFHEGKFSSVAEMTASPVVSSGSMEEPSIEFAGMEDHYGYEFSGYLNVPEKAVWEFFTKSDDGSMLYIDGVEVVNNDGSHASVSASGSIALDKGFHEFRLLYFEDYEGQDLSWGWKRRGEDDYRQIGKENLFRK